MQSLKIIFPFFTLLSACAFNDVGEVDYRKAEQPATVMASDGGAACQPAEIESDQKNQCPPLFSGKLFRKYSASGETITFNTVYSINLERGLIASMNESPFSPKRLLTGKNPLQKIGEIAILAAVFESANSQAEANSGQTRFADLTDLNALKVVYYSPDVEAGQTLNFSNISVQAPTIYNGNKISIQIVVIELDRTNGPLQALMQQLASLGAKTAGLPTSGTSKILTDLGTSLLTKANDDVIFDFRFTLDPAGAVGAAGPPVFEAGRYILRRTDNRQAEAIWKNLVVDHDSGELMRQTNSGTVDSPMYKYSQFADDTWFTINVVKHPLGTKPSYYAEQRLEQFNKQLRTASEASGAALTTATNALITQAATLRSENWGDKVLAAAQNLVESYRVYTRALVPAASPDTEKCTINPNAEMVESQRLFEAETTAYKFADIYNSALNDKNGNEAIFKENDQRAALYIFSQYFAPLPYSNAGTGNGSKIENNDLLSPTSAFVVKFVKDGKIADLTTLMKAKAETLAASTCEMLITNGVATGVVPPKP